MPNPALTTQWNLGYNREPCTPCDGANGTITTAGPRSTSSEDCVVPAGHGTTRTPGGARTGAPCPPDTFGSPNDTSGPEDVSWWVEGGRAGRVCWAPAASVLLNRLPQGSWLHN